MFAKWQLVLAVVVFGVCTILFLSVFSPFIALFGFGKTLLVLGGVALFFLGRRKLRKKAP